MKQMYLAGSFTGFRDDIITAIGDTFSIVDARKNPQYAMYETNASDLQAARESGLMSVCFPQGNNGEKKVPGVMTFVEIGHSYSAGNKIIVADEVEFKGFVKNMADQYFTSIQEELIPFLQDINISPSKGMQRPEEHRGTVEAILTYDVPVKHNAKIIKPPSVEEELYLHKEKLIDLLVVGFPKGEPHNRRAAFSMGMANYFKIPIIVYTDRKVPYPPLTGGLQRRLFTDIEPLNEYINNIESNDIAREAPLMYKLFKKYDGAM